MTLLTRLFPDIVEAPLEGVPSWKDGENPWSIFALGDHSLTSQLMRIVGTADGVFIHPDAEIGEFVRIEGPSYVGANAEIRHSAYLRKGSWICDGAVVGHSSEVKNSILLPNSKAPHFNYVGDSILGFGVNIGAGVKLSNVRNDGGDIAVTLENGEKVDTGLRKLGALIGDDSQLGCNVVTNPGSIIVPCSMISPNETVTGWFGVKS